MRRSRKPLCGYPHRGFEFHPLRREALKLAAELALDDYKLRLQIAPPGTPFPPATVFIAYQVAIMKLIEKGKFTPKTYKALTLKHDKVLEALRQVSAERAASGKGPLD